MPVFSYRSTTRDGVTADGIIEAPDEKTAVEQLRTSGLIPLEVRLPRESWRMPLRVKTGQAEGMETVAQLLESARKGQLAGSTALQSRQALTSGEYEQAIQLANSALEQFAALGDFRREAEISAYRQRAEEVLMLRSQAAELMAQARLLSNPSEAVAALRGLQARLTALGDTQGSQGISQTVQEVEDILTKRQNRSYLLIAGVALLLLVARIGLSFCSKPVEANL